MPEETLHEILTTGLKLFKVSNYYQKNVPDCISDNLNPAFELRPYQFEAFGRFKFYREEYRHRPPNQPIEILYHMATGSGKTLVMAGLMLYLYEQGYRNFLFFVNSTNIIQKTRDNFLNGEASKYLFNEHVQINNRQIRIKEVENFQAANADDINIVFSTIQGLHSRLNTPCENSLTYDDFENEKIVLLSDEAHHINVGTRLGNLGQRELISSDNWESTVTKICHANVENILLEFTATIDLSDENIETKYHDKIIYDYPLREFRQDGYSKEVKVLQTDATDMDRVLQAVLLNQFRLKVFAKYGQQINRSIKPVILFKSKTISESCRFFDEFIVKIKKLTGRDIKKIKNNPNLDKVMQSAFAFFAKNNISLDNLALELRESFSEDKCISVNSKNESEQKQIAVNTLEDANNEYRAVFAVDKLNEGWDVLNLFDIVRLYNTRDAGQGRAGKTTMSEAQLIGRGARYCPFRLSKDQPLFQRKYDTCTEEQSTEIKICEELYYHSTHNPRYIQELHQALEEIGIKSKNTTLLEIFLKPEFKKEPFYKTGFIFKNEKIVYNRENVVSVSASFIDFRHKIPLLTGFSESRSAFGEEVPQYKNTKSKDYDLKIFGSCVIRKALNQFPEFYFSNLKKLFPKLKSVDSFINSNAYLGEIKLEVEGTENQVENLTQDEKLEISIHLLNKLKTQLRQEHVEFKGTKEFKPYPVAQTFVDKKTSIVEDKGAQEYGTAQSKTNNTDLQFNVAETKWYAFNENYGTDQEKYFIKYMAKVIDELTKKYTTVYLLRNERHFQLFNFDNGQAFEPDFVLFLLKEVSGVTTQYQVFIEPKGNHLIEHDAWKQDFLLRLKEEHDIEKLWQNKEYIVWGMPFYNEPETVPKFEDEFKHCFKSEV